MQNKYYLALDDTERKILISSLNNLLSEHIQQNEFTDGVDDVFIKIISAKKKNFKIEYAEK